MASNWEEFYAKTPKPQNLEENKRLLNNFIERHAEGNTKIVLVTSGGTTVPLEHNTVRFVDNFSAGNRGAISAEYFLDHGYAVIFMYRLKSLEPFSRHFTGHKFLNMLELSTLNNTPSISVAPEYVNEVSNILTKYKEATSQNKLLEINFTTLSEYLWLLRISTNVLAQLENRVSLYLAAAVSDFYIPPNEMAVHKIPSSGPPSIQLQLVPKVLEPLVNLWVPKAFVISFKLETDENILVKKAREALNRYKHTLVIANMLQTRRKKVVFVTENYSYPISLTKEQIEKEEEIEKFIVDEVVKQHESWISSRDSK